ncbi:MAG: aldo/keto reductase [Clostridiales bacterium]|nr:aldo/keto reductase [Clostridiales bacterium]MCF8021871.1 aldo/keto reductase [Clostridiales bacterium]
MKYRTLGQTGINASVIGFGGIPVQRISEDEAEIVVDKALDMGINFFDTARGYTDSEVKLGKVLGKRRSEAVIATKSMARSKEEMAKEIRSSLNDIGVDYIDLYQFHNVKDKDSYDKIFAPGGALEALKEAKEEGLVKHIGITGHVKTYLRDALKTGEVETVQFPFNAVETEDDAGLFSLAREMNVGIIVMKPLAGGALNNINYALRYILEYPVSVIIPGMDSVEQVEENVKAGACEALSEEEKNKLAKEAGELGTVFCRRCEYCQPCPQGINIPVVFLLHGYYTRYNLKDWAKERYKTLPVKVDACIECGECEEKCPYNLPVRQLLKEAAETLK